MTNKEAILNYLKGNSWINKGTICSDIVEMSDKPVYHDTIGRALRSLAEEGVIVKRKEGKGTAYMINEFHTKPTKVSDMIKRQEERVKKEEEDKIPTLCL